MAKVALILSYEKVSFFRGFIARDFDCRMRSAGEGY